MNGHRSAWATAPDAVLLAECDVDTYRASGPGGQKRNKTSSAVRLRHRPSGLMVIAEESRSQHENRDRALKRLRRAFFLELREPARPEAIAAARGADGRLFARPKTPGYLNVAAVLLDMLDANRASVRDAAAMAGTTTANLIDFLKAEVKVWQAVNQLRARHGQKSLRA